MNGKPKPEDPETPEQWAVAMKAAHLWRVIADYKMYGLLEGGPAIDIARVDYILATGRKLGHEPPSPTWEEIACFIELYNDSISGEKAKSPGAPFKEQPGPQTKT